MTETDMRRRVRRMTAAVALLVTASLSLAACGDGSVELRVAPDGAMTLAIEFAPDSVTRAQLPPEMFPMLAEQMKLAMPGLVYEELSQNGRPAHRFTVPVLGPESLHAALVNPPTVPGVARAQLFESMTLEQLGPEAWRFAGVMRPMVDIAREMFAGQDIPAPTAEQMSGPGASMTFVVGLPGNTQSTTGRPTGQGTATWSIEDMASPHVIVITTSPEPSPVDLGRSPAVQPADGGDSVWDFAERNRTVGVVLVAGALGLIVLISVAAAIRRRRQYNGPRIAVPPNQTGPHGHPGAAWQPHGGGQGPPVAGGPSGPAPAAPAVVLPPVPRGGATMQQAPRPDPPAGWYPDPAGTGGRRWWSGTEWTDHVE